MYNHCQNPRCHYHDTQDRIRGSKGNKVYVTRKSTNYYGIACTLFCLNEYWKANRQAIIRAVPERPKQSRSVNAVWRNNEWVDE